MIYSFFYVLMASVGLVLTEYLDQSVPPLLSLIIASLIATIFFHVVNFGKWRSLYIGCWKQKWLYLALMLSVLIIWVCSMYGPELLGASQFNFFYFSSLGGLGFFIKAVKEFEAKRMELYIGSIIIILMVVVIYDNPNGHGITNFLIGIFLSLLAGIFSFIYFKQSQALLKKASLSATQILATRFYLTIIVLFLIVPKENLFVYLTIKNVIEILLLSFLTMIVQLFFVQKALEKISAEQNSIIVSLTPAITGILQQTMFKNVPALYVSIYFFYAFLIVLYNLINMKKIQVI